MKKKKKIKLCHLERKCPDDTIELLRFKHLNVSVKSQTFKTKLVKMIETQKTFMLFINVPVLKKAI